MKKLNWGQVAIVLIGFLFLLFTPIMIMNPFNIYYTSEEPVGPSLIYPVWTYTCPAAVDQNQCSGPEQVCADCKQIADRKIMWFAILESLLLVGTVGGVFLASRTGKKEA